jgi:hypothetical protein
MGRVLEMDELDTGMFLTVLQGAIDTRIVRGPQGESVPRSRENTLLNGKVLKVTAVDMPYIAVEFFQLTTKELIKRMTLDVREITLGSLTYDYILAAEPRWSDSPRYQEHEIDWSYEEWQEQEVYEKK